MKCKCDGLDVCALCEHKKGFEIKALKTGKEIWLSPAEAALLSIGAFTMMLEIKNNADGLYFEKDQQDATSAYNKINSLDFDNGPELVCSEVFKDE